VQTATNTPGAALTATLAITPTDTPRATRPPATPAPTQPPKPAAPTGRIAYDIFLGGTDLRAHTIHVASVSAGAGGQLIERASWPAFSPDGGKIAYFHWQDGLYVANADGSGAQGPLVVSPGICCINWSGDGKNIVFANSPRPSQPGGPISMLRMDVPYNPKDPAIIPLGVSGNGPAFAPGGKQIVFSGCQINTNTCGLHIVPTDGSGTMRLLTSDNGGNAHWSPDGRRIVYQVGSPSQIFVINVDGTGKRQLTTSIGNNGQPVWSRDGGSIFYRSDQGGAGWAIYAMNADGSNQRRLINNTPPHPDLWGWQSLTVAP
jgi:Tol biopolymer transport system component